MRSSPLTRGIDPLDVVAALAQWPLRVVRAPWGLSQTASGGADLSVRAPTWVLQASRQRAGLRF